MAFSTGGFCCSDTLPSPAALSALLAKIKGGESVDLSRTGKPISQTVLTPVAMIPATKPAIKPLAILFLTISAELRRRKCVGAAETPGRECHPLDFRYFNLRHLLCAGGKYPRATAGYGLLFGVALYSVTHATVLPALDTEPWFFDNKPAFAISEFTGHMAFAVTAETTRRFIGKKLA